ncbi:MAG: hypothetical protein JW995_06495 [Melioribacteraceae bacterium]|nr:hypothetical protein [Melioribacteraceae bacterium]
MHKFDLAIAYKWFYDKELTVLIENLFQRNGLTTFIVDLNNLYEVTSMLKEGTLFFKAVLDRGSDEDERFTEMAKILSTNGTLVINEYSKVEQSIDKAQMHKKLIELKMPVPETIILPAFDKEEKLSINKFDLEKLGNPFVIKPSYYTGGGEGVIVNATSIQQIENSRLINKDDRYLVQRKIFPKIINGKRAWFRLFWFFDEVFPAWWDDNTHIFHQISEEEYNIIELERMKDYTRKIAEATGMDYFSTEITIDVNDKMYIIDYVNDQCDFRRKSLHVDGVPDVLVYKFVEKMYYKVKSLQ